MNVKAKILCSLLFVFLTAVGSEVNKIQFINLESSELEDVLLSYLDNNDEVGACNYFREQIFNHPTLTPDRKYESERIGDHLLILASLSGFVRVVRRLLEEKHDPDTGTYYGTTPLFHAVESGKADIVKLLLDFGADAHCVTRYGEKLQNKLKECKNKLIQVVFAMYTEHEIVKQMQE